jgi:hypothetical protein
MHRALERLGFTIGPGANGTVVHADLRL